MHHVIFSDDYDRDKFLQRLGENITDTEAVPKEIEGIVVPYIE